MHSRGAIYCLIRLHPHHTCSFASTEVITSMSCLIRVRLKLGYCRQSSGRWIFLICVIFNERRIHFLQGYFGFGDAAGTNTRCLFAIPAPNSNTATPLCPVLALNGVQNAWALKNDDEFSPHDPYGARVVINLQPAEEVTAVPVLLTMATWHFT